MQYRILVASTIVLGGAGCARDSGPQKSTTVDRAALQFYDSTPIRMSALRSDSHVKVFIDGRPIRLDTSAARISDATRERALALAQEPGVDRISGCYQVTWSDSLNSADNRPYYNLPPAFRLEAQADTSGDIRLPSPLAVTLLETIPDSAPEPPRASWTLLGHDSVSIRMRGWPPINWELGLRARADSLVGTVWGYVGDGSVGPYPVLAKRVTCR